MPPASYQINIDMLPEPARSAAREAGVKPNQLAFWWTAFASGQQHPTQQGDYFAQRTLIPTPVVPSKPSGLSSAPYVSEADVIALKADTDVPEVIEGAVSDPTEKKTGVDRWWGDMVTRAHTFFVDKGDVSRDSVEAALKAHKEVKAWINADRPESPSIRILDSVIEKAMEQGRLKKPSMNESKFES